MKFILEMKGVTPPTYCSQLTYECCGTASETADVVHRVLHSMVLCHID